LPAGQMAAGRPQRSFSLIPASFMIAACSLILRSRLPLIAFISDGKLHDRIVPFEMNLIHLDAQAAFHCIIQVFD